MFGEGAPKRAPHKFTRYAESRKSKTALRSTDAEPKRVDFSYALKRTES